MCIRKCVRTFTLSRPPIYQATLARPLPPFLSRYLILYSSVAHTHLAINSVCVCVFDCRKRRFGATQHIVLQCVDTSKLQRGCLGGLARRSQGECVRRGGCRWQMNTSGKECAPNVPR